MGFGERKTFAKSIVTGAAHTFTVGFLDFDLGR